MKAYLVTLLAFIFVIPTSPAITDAEFKQAGFDQNIGRQISHELMFRDSAGVTARLDRYINNKPTLVVLGYYHCPMLCTLINDGLINAMQQLRLDVGRDFNVIEISIDPRETPALAKTKKNQYLKRYGRLGAETGWHFLTGDEKPIQKIASEGGFRFVYDPESNEYAHPSGVIVLTPQARISRYFLGVNIDPRELNNAIRAAAREETGSVIDRLILLCYHYNPITGKYGALILRVLRLSGALTVLVIITLIARQVGRDRTEPVGHKARRIIAQQPIPTDRLPRWRDPYH